MALPYIAAGIGIAAKTVAKKLATRTTSGIVGTGGKSVNPIYNTPSLAKIQAKGIAKLTGAGIATGGLTQVPAVKESIKRQVQEANKNKRK
jgi:hypothetical protein